MQQLASIDLVGDRYTPFSESLVFFGFDFTSASFAMQVRDSWNGGTLRADLATTVSSSAQGVRMAYAGTATIADHITAGRVSLADATAAGYISTDSVLLTHLTLRINESTMEAMPLADPDANEDLELVYDLHITPSGSSKAVFVRGTFTVRAGSTQ